MEIAENDILQHPTDLVSLIFPATSVNPQMLGEKRGILVTLNQFGLTSCGVYKTVTKVREPSLHRHKHLASFLHQRH